MLIVLLFCVIMLSLSVAVPLQSGMVFVVPFPPTSPLPVPVSERQIPPSIQMSLVLFTVMFPSTYKRLVGVVVPIPMFPLVVLMKKLLLLTMKSPPMLTSSWNAKFPALNVPGLIDPAVCPGLAAVVSVTASRVSMSSVVRRFIVLRLRVFLVLV